MTAPAPDSSARLFIIFNLGSGHEDAAMVRRTLTQTLESAGRPYELHEIREPGHLASTAADCAAQALACGGILVAAGGDGTVNSVAQAAVDAGCMFGVLPQGTFNYFSRTHGIPTETAAAVNALLDGHITPVQVGLVNDRVFLVNASLGLYPEILENRESYKRQFGRHRFVALWSALATLLREHRQLRVRLEHDGTMRQVRTPMLFVGNNRLQLEQIGIQEAPVLDEGQLAAVMPRAVGMFALLWLVVRGAYGSLGEAQSVVTFCFRELTVKPALPYGTRRIKVATDGEIAWLTAPLVFKVAPHPLRLLVPRVPLPAA